MMTQGDKTVSLKARQTLFQTKAAPARPTKADRADDATKAAARKRLATAVAKSRILKALARQLRAAAQDRERREAGDERSRFCDVGSRALGPRALKQQARSRIRAAVQRQLRQAQAPPRPAPERSPTRARGKQTKEDEHWQTYRRQNERWRPPPEPAEPHGGPRGPNKKRPTRKATEPVARTPLRDFGARLPGAAPPKKRQRTTRQRRRHGRGASSTPTTASTATTTTTSTSRADDRPRPSRAPGLTGQPRPTKAPAKEPPSAASTRGPSARTTSF